jgi:predicted membrane-bound spermidine synthase
MPKLKRPPKSTGFARIYLFSLAALEGAAVMACELIGAKEVAPFFGSSLYVWAAVLGVTLAALMTGYYTGGWISHRYQPRNLIFGILVAAGTLLVIMPFTGPWIMESMLGMSVRLGTTLSLMVFMFPPLMLMGMSSPIIIGLLNESIETSGKSAGSVYAISTLGGIIATFSTGFYLLPELGIRIPALIFGGGLALAALIGGLRSKSFIAAGVVLPLAVWGLFSVSELGNKSIHYSVKYHTEGILGQLRVVDQQYYTQTRGWMPGRSLMVNNTVQTILDLENPEYSLWDWAYYFPLAASIYPRGSEALLLGLGGGTLVKQFQRLGFSVEAVELDERIRDVARDYFSVDPEVPVIIDDARHYLNTTDRRYEVIALDLFHNETPPAHVLTVESFRRLRQVLKPGGMLMINFYGYTTGSIGRPSRCIYKTLVEAGFDTQLFVTPGEEGGRNLIFLASTEPKDFSIASYAEPGLPVVRDMTKMFLDRSKLDLSDAVVLSDQRPALEKYYIEAAVAWREAATKTVTSRLLDENIAPFH